MMKYIGTALRLAAAIVGMLLLCTDTFAQTYRQRGVVRMITRSKADALTPVSGVKVVVGNAQSDSTGSDGSFTMEVPKEFQVNGVIPGDYVLCLPTVGKDSYPQPNDLEVVVTTKKRQEDSQKLYDDLVAKYRKQTQELNALRQQIKDQLRAMEQTDAKYARTKEQLDSLQAL